MLTLLVKAILVPILLERLVDRIEIRQEIEPILNVPLSVVISGGLTLVGYVVAESFYHPEQTPGAASLGHNTLAVAISLFLIGFFMMINRRKALTQVLALLSLENGLFLAAISLTYGMPLIVELGVFFDVLVAVHGARHPGLPHSRDVRIDGRQQAAEAARLTDDPAAFYFWFPLAAGVLSVARPQRGAHGSDQPGRVRG